MHASDDEHCVQCFVTCVSMGPGLTVSIPACRVTVIYLCYPCKPLDEDLTGDQTMPAKLSEKVAIAPRYSAPR